MAKKTHLNAYFEKELTDRLLAEAEVEMRSASQMMKHLVKEALDARDARRNSKPA